jgi:hypothetical protein
MKKVHVVTVAIMLLLSIEGRAQQQRDAGSGLPQAQQSEPGTPSKGSAPPPGTVSGSGTANYVPLWTSSTALGNSHLYQGSLGTGVGTTSPQYALDVDGHINSSSGYLVGESLVLTTPGGVSNGNIALGLEALIAGTTGLTNTAIGDYTLQRDTTGSGNTAGGYAALDLDTTGSFNTANGQYPLYYNTTGSFNTAIGVNALYYNTTGDSNIAVGYNAAYDVSAGNSNNIHIGNMGVSADSGTIRIGTSGTQTSFFAAGIYGVSSGSSSAIPVLVDSSGQLVTVSSSRRFKEDIHDMGDASRDLMRLRPVTFRYQKPLADGSQPVQYGLIAEEVAEVYPDLVAYSADGQIETVKYQLLDPMLLNEVQRQQAEIHELQDRLNKIESALAQSTAGAQPK